MPENAAIEFERQLNAHSVFKQGHAIERSRAAVTIRKASGDIPIDHRAALQSMARAIVGGKRLNYSASPKSGPQIVIQFFQK